MRHPNIVPLYEAGEVNGRAYLASAFIPGTTLADALDEKAMEPRRAAELVRKLADALAYAHTQGVIHRDVKSVNVMLDPAGEPHLLDFGLARRLEDSALVTQDGTVLGTPAYLAPEVCRGERDRWSPAADQYALGVVLYELLTGRQPFEGPTAVVLTLHITQEPTPPTKVNAAVPCDLDAVCLKCLEKEPQRRYADCAALAEDLRRWSDGLPTAARPLSVLEQVFRWSRRHRTISALASALVVSVLVGLASTLNLVLELRREASERRATVIRVIRFFREDPTHLHRTDNDKLVAAFLGANPDISLQQLKNALGTRNGQDYSNFAIAPLASTGGGSSNPNMIGD